MRPQRVAGGVALGLDQVVQVFQQLRVVQQQRVQVQELARFLRQGTAQALAQRLHLLAGSLDGRMQPGALGRNGGRGDALFADLQYMRQPDPGAPQRASA